MLIYHLLQCFNQINPRTVAEFTNLVKRNRKGDVPSVSYTPSPPLPDLSVLKSLKEVCPRGAFFSLIPKLDPEETDSASEDEDESNLPQPLTALYSEEYATLTKHQLKEKCSQLAKELQVTPEQCKELEKVTRNQSICPLWFEHRKGRITASKAHRVLKRKESTPPDNLLKSIMGYEAYDLCKIKPIRWGIDNEEKARVRYIEEKKLSHHNFECTLSGFVIDLDRPYLGASADGIATCKCCPPRVVEIKCPFKHKDVLPMEAAKSDPDFCLDDKGHLKETHAYYTQIQLQEHVNRMEVGDFCVYTNKDLHIVEGIPLNKHFIEHSLTKLDSFFKNVLLPEILTRKLQISEMGDENCEQDEEQLYCICNHPEYGKMIACDNSTCDIVWFHYACVNIRRKPKGKWYCPHCKNEN